MKESLWGYYLVLLGIMVSTVMIMVTNMTTTSQQDYYLLKEITNAAMIDAIDFGYYTKYGEPKINTEKFVENFIRRFSESITKTNSYKIDFYSIYENPPSVSIKVTSNTGDYNIAGDSTNIDVINTIDAILEANNTVTYSEVFYSVPYASCDKSSYIKEDYLYCQLTNRAHINLDYNSHIYNEIKSKLGVSELDASKIKILNVEYLSVLSTADDLNKYNEMYAKMYMRERTLDDVPDSISNKQNYFAKNVKNVKVTVKQEGDKYYLGYGLDFNCDGTSTFKYYRKGTTIDDMQYKTEAEYNALSEAEKANYEKAPFYDNCLVGIKYRINFYYDNN